MKKYLILAMVAALGFTSCGNNKETETEQTAEAASSDTEAVAHSIRGTGQPNGTISALQGLRGSAHTQGH